MSASPQSAVCQFTTFAELADASQLSAAGQVLLRYVQRRAIASFEEGGFQCAAWASRSTSLSDSVRTIKESLRVVDPLSDEVFDMELRFTLMQVDAQIGLTLELCMRSDTADRHVTNSEIAYIRWVSPNLRDIEERCHEAYHRLVTPEGISDDVFAGLASKLSFALAP
jgi:hypothetical protein